MEKDERSVSDWRRILRPAEHMILECIEKRDNDGTDGEIWVRAVGWTILFYQCWLPDQEDCTMVI